MNYNKQLASLEPPYIHLAFGTRQSFYAKAWKWYFYKDINLVVRIIKGWKAIDVGGLFNEFSAALQFPDYFGENWDAFDECLNDLEWLPADAYLLFVSDIDKVLQNDEEAFKVFIKILLNSVSEWTTGRTYNTSFCTPPIPFHIVFQCVEDQADFVKKRLANVGASSIDSINLSSSDL